MTTRKPPANGPPAAKVYDVPVPDAAVRIGVSVETIKRYARMGKVPAEKTFNGRWMFCLEDLDDIHIHEIVIGA